MPLLPKMLAKRLALALLTTIAAPAPETVLMGVMPLMPPEFVATRLPLIFNVTPFASMTFWCKVRFVKTSEAIVPPKLMSTRLLTVVSLTPVVSSNNATLDEPGTPFGVQFVAVDQFVSVLTFTSALQML